MTNPEYFVTITSAGPDWATVRDRMAKAKRRMKKKGYAVNWAYCVEPHRSHLLLHVHAWLWGLDPAGLLVLGEVLRSLGMGPRIDMPSARDYSKHYPLKMCLNGDAAEAKLYLKNNGKRLIHTTQGFWRDSSGRVIRGQRAAVQAAQPARGGSTWFVQPV